MLGALNHNARRVLVSMHFSIAISGRIILWTDHQTSTLLRTFVDGLNDIDQLLLILKHPVQLVVVACTEIAHHMFVAKEEHERADVVELIHLLEVWYLIKIADIDYSEVLDAVGDLVENFILFHAIRIPVAPESDDHKPVFFSHDSLVDMPASDQMRYHNRSHGCSACVRREKRSVCKK